MSLWKVPDRETSEIMIAFYKHLANGLPKDEALKEAKQDFLINNAAYPALQHPYYWSGFVLSGDPSPIKRPNTHRLIYLLGGISVLVFLYILFRKRLI